MRRLLIRPGAIGDCLCSLPALYLLQSDETEIWTNGLVAPLVRHVTRCRSLAGTGFSLLGIPSTDPPSDLVNILRSFDDILSWSGHNQPVLHEAAQKFGLPIQFFPPLPDPHGEVHVSDFLIAQTAAYHGFLAEPEEWRQPGGRRFLLRRREQSSTPDHAGHVVVLHPFSGSPAKNWPLAHFRRLADHLQSVCSVRWCAGPEDPLPSDLRAHAWQFDNLITLAEHLEQVSLFVGNDSGTTHLAALMGIPILAIFGPMSPQVWAPRGSVSRIVQAPVLGQSASAVPYELVAEAVEDLLMNLDVFCK